MSVNSQTGTWSQRPNPSVGGVSAGTESDPLDRHIHLLPREALIKTGPVDHADWNYKPLLGWIQRQRFQLAQALLPSKPVPRLLEIGYGSGVFMPELSQRCEELHGVDIHGRNSEVARELAKQGISAQLHVATTEALPFEDHSFDCAIAVSSLEFVDDVSAACREVARVLKPHGSFIVITPGHSTAIDLGLTLLTGESARKDYGGARESLMGGIEQHFRVVQALSFPSMASEASRLYRAFQLQPLPSKFQKKIACSDPESLKRAA